MAEAVSTANIDVKNYLRLHSLLNTTVNAFLRKWFSKNWLDIAKSEWEDNTECRVQFVDGVGRELFSSSKLIQKKYLQKASISLWDLPLLADAAKCMERKLGRQKNKHFDGLKAFRNKLAHLGNMEITNHEFEKYWGEISAILLSLGMPHSEIDAAKTVNLQNEIVSKSEDVANETNQRNADVLKEKGNAFFREKNYQAAIVAYSEAILITGHPSNYSALLYTNRSLTFLRIGDLQAAKEDARGAIHLRPNWWKGYARLANAYQELGKYRKALKYHEIVLGFEPNADDIKDARDFCRHMVAKLARSDHLDPFNFRTTFEDTVEHMKEMEELPLSAPGLAKSQKLNYDIGLPIGICGEAHNYLHGRGVSQNYETAATLFAKAAGKGSAEGLYNLAVLTREGRGVTRSVFEATRMMFEAAGQEPFVELLPGSGIKAPNIGVMESQHSLGLAYENGVGVEVNFTKAIEWYEKALVNGSGNSGNNMAFMYLEGRGVPVNIEKGFQFWKVAALKGCIRAMENLALNYTVSNLEEAQKWFTVAVEKGSMTLPLRRQEFLIDTLPLKEFNSEEFLEDVIDVLMNGHMKRFARPSKHSFANLSKMMADSFTTSTLQPKGDYRMQIILEHRKGIKLMKSGTEVTYSANPAKFVPNAAADLIGLKPIHFGDMKDQSEDHVFEGFAIRLVIVEDAILGRPSIPLIGQDENGDIQRIFVYNYPQNKETQSSLGYGCRITIINPYFRIALDHKPAIRVDEPSLLFANPKLRDENRCRYCGQDNGTIPCRKCRRVFYCSKLCLKKDSEDLQHSLVCFKRI